jgi:hypothetical protein
VREREVWTGEEDSGFEGWAILELMGHRRLAGYLTEQQVAGAGFVRIEIPGPEGPDDVTQFYAPGAIYCITPTTEATARRVALLGRPQPVSEWELPAPARPGPEDLEGDGEPWLAGQDIRDQLEEDARAAEAGAMP